MKAVRNKILSGMMALVLVVSLFATTTGDAYAATEWIDFDNKYMRHDIGKAIDEA